MRAYFPLPPTISIEGFQEKIVGSITFLNCPNNRLKPFFSKKVYKDKVYLGIYLFNNQTWNLLGIEECLAFDFLEITRNDFHVKDNQMIVVVLKKNKDFKEVSKNLPEPDSLKVDNSIVEQRVSMNFSFLKAITSYQGEYPFNMSKLGKGSLFTFDALKEPRNSFLRNFVILMNISKYYSYLEPERIKIFNPENKEKFKYLDAFRNSFTIFESTSYERLLDSQKTIFFTSETCSFIPIILTLNLKTHQLSVEHTHPPSEYFFGPQKFEFMNLIKKTWI